ncbi:MAG: mechanosensitive ion channel [Coriobacteriia bacterium]|nr:mechanosensitive ion channel [Coriobacteriia bacterium]
MGFELGEWAYVAVVIVGSLLAGFVIDLGFTAILGHDSGPAARPRVALANALRGQYEVWAVLLGVAIFKPFHFLEPKALEWTSRIIIVVAVLSVTVFFARLAGKLIRAYLAKDSVNAPSGTIFVNLARLVIWAIGLTFVLGALGVQIGPLVASLGVVGIAVSLGLQDTLANFFAGLQVTLSRQIQPGQYIRLSTMQEGLVMDVTWRNTTLLAPSNDLLIIPNTVIATTLVTNFTADDEEHIEPVPFTVTYGSDLDEVKRIAVKVARAVRKAHAEAIDDFEPVCTFRAFGPEGISAAVTIRVTRFQDRLPVVSDLIEQLHHELAESADVELATGLSVSAKPLA